LAEREFKRECAEADYHMQREAKVSQEAITQMPELARGLSEVAAVASQLSDLTGAIVTAMTAPTVVVRDEQTGAIIGARKDLAAAKRIDPGRAAAAITAPLSVVRGANGEIAGAMRDIQ